MTQLKINMEILYTMFLVLFISSCKLNRRFKLNVPFTWRKWRCERDARFELRWIFWRKPIHIHSQCYRASANCQQYNEQQHTFHITWHKTVSIFWNFKSTNRRYSSGKKQLHFEVTFKFIHEISWIILTNNEQMKQVELYLLCGLLKCCYSKQSASCSHTR